MKKIRSILMSIVALALLSATGIAEKANADVRVNATLRTPGVRVHIGNSPYSRNRSVTITNRTVVASHVYRVTRYDRNVAFRLSSYTGVPVRRMIRLRSAGFGWFQIGNRLRMPRPVVRAALQPATWQRLLRRQRRQAKCGTGRGSWQVTHDDQVIYDDDYYIRNGY